MVVHADHHRNEDDRVVEQMKFHAGNIKLDETHRNRRATKVLPDEDLRLQDRVFYVVPELDAERDHPPFIRQPLESFAERPETDQHNQGISIMKRL